MMSASAAASPLFRFCNSRTSAGTTSGEAEPIACNTCTAQYMVISFESASDLIMAGAAAFACGPSWINCKAACACSKWLITGGDCPGWAFSQDSRSAFGKNSVQSRFVMKMSTSSGTEFVRLSWAAFRIPFGSPTPGGEPVWQPINAHVTPAIVSRASASAFVHRVLGIMGLWVISCLLSSLNLSGKTSYESHHTGQTGAWLIFALSWMFRICLPPQVQFAFDCTLPWHDGIVGHGRLFVKRKSGRS